MRLFKSYYFYAALILSVCAMSCEDPVIKKNGNAPIDNRDLYVGKYLPLYFGSKWFYNQSKVDKGKVLSTSQLVRRYDSLPDVIHIYNPTTLIAWIYCERKDDHHFVAGGGQNFLDDTYLDSTEGKAFITEQGSAYKHYAYGGLVQVPTKFGQVHCIKTSGVSGTTSSYYYFRYFGLGYGLVLEEEYGINSSGDTTNHYITELDSCFINR